MVRERARNLILLLLAFSVVGFSVARGSTPPEAEGLVLYYFWGTGCPHCEEAKPFLAELESRIPQLEVRSYDIMASKENLQIWIETAGRFGSRPSGVPAFYCCGQAFEGYTPEIERQIEQALQGQLAEAAPQITIPFIGTIDPGQLSLPVFTLIIASLDSFNPCAFFVLLFLLSLLIHAHSRKRMLLIGGTFVLCSGLIYFLFMAAWLNLFLVIGHMGVITLVAGLFALGIGLINTKDFFFFKKGVSLTLSEEAKPKLFARMRGLLKADSMGTMLVGTLVLAVAANSYELLCTAGFPMVYTRVLTLQDFAPGVYYLYLGFYNLVYVIPLAVVVIVFTATLGSKKLSEWQGRVLKLISGVMMALLGAVLLLKPNLLNNPVLSTGLLLLALLVAGTTAFVSRKLNLA